MLQPQLFPKIQKDDPKDEVSTNAKLLIRAGFVRKLMSGVYSFLPLGVKVMDKIEGIIRDEMNQIGGREIFMPALHPRHIWEETGRWEKLKDIMYQFRDASGQEYGLGTTHEEIIADIVRKEIKTYRDLPLYLYQFQTKFRNEPRAKSGLIRTREFVMKDLYSFHADEGNLNNYYQTVIRAYFRIFKRCRLKARIVEASGGTFTKHFSHEFQVISQAGEDKIIFCKKCDFSRNKEIAAELKTCPQCEGEISEEKSVEVGNIFKFYTKYADEMGLKYIDKEGNEKPIYMGSYGIGPARVMGTIVEVYHDEKGIIWPDSVAPFDVHILELPSSRKIIRAKVKKVSETLYKNLQKSGVEVLYDDREDKSPGEKFSEADLIGIPLRLVVSERTLAKNSVEVKKRNEEKIRLVMIRKIQEFLKSKAQMSPNNHSDSTGQAN